MIARILNAYYVEITKAARLKATYVGPVLVVVLVAASPLLEPLSGGGDGGYVARGYDFIAFVAPMTLNVLGLTIVVVYSSGLIASEISAGTLRMVFVRPIRRREFLAAKLLWGMTYAMGLTALTTGCVWGVACVFGGLSGIERGGEIIYADSAMRLAYAWALLLSALPLLAASAYGIFISVCLGSATSGATVALGLGILLEMLKYRLGIDAFVFTSYLDSVWEVFASRCDGFDAGWSPIAESSAAVSLASVALFSQLAAFVLNRRNIRT